MAQYPEPFYVGGVAYMRAYAGAGVVVADTHYPHSVGRVVGKFPEVYDRGGGSAGHELHADLEPAAYYLVDAFFDAAHLCFVRTGGEEVVALALLALYVGVPRTGAAEHPRHRGVQYVFGRMRRFVLLLVVLRGAAVDGYLHHSVDPALEQSVGLVNLRQGEAAAYQRSGVEPAASDQRQDFRTFASVYASCLESEVLAVHLRQRQALGLSVHRDYRHRGVRPRTLPCETEALLRARQFYYRVCPSVPAVLHDEAEALLRSRNKHIGIVPAHEPAPFRGLLADYYLLRMPQHRA